MNTPRNFKCPMTNAPCTNPECTRPMCVLQQRSKFRIQQLEERRAVGREHGYLSNESVSPPTVREDICLWPLPAPRRGSVATLRIRNLHRMSNSGLAWSPQKQSAFRRRRCKHHNGDRDQMHTEIQKALKADRVEPKRIRRAQIDLNAHPKSPEPEWKSWSR